MSKHPGDGVNAAVQNLNSEIAAAVKEGHNVGVEVLSTNRIGESPKPVVAAVVTPKREG